MTSGADDGSTTTERRHPAAVILGGLAGVVVGLVVLPVTGLLLNQAGTTDERGDGSDPLFWAGVAGGLVVGTLVLLSARMRSVGAGLVLGVAGGLALGSALCLAFVFVMDSALSK
jgi:hypothetical protein